MCVAVQTDGHTHVAQCHHSSQTSPSPTITMTDSSTTTQIHYQTTVERCPACTSLASSPFSTCLGHISKDHPQDIVPKGHIVHSKLSLPKHVRSYSDGHRLLTSSPARESLSEVNVSKLFDRSCHAEVEVEQELLPTRPKKLALSDIRKHKCLWQKEVKTLQIKLRSLRKQVR